MSYISNLIEGNYLLIRSALIIIIIILLVTLFVVFLKNFRKPRKEQRVLRRGVDNNLQRIEKLRHLNKDPGEKLLLLDNIVLAYLSGIVKINKKEGYEKISKKLKEKGDSKLADFCDNMEYYLYGNVEVSNQDIINLINKFESLVKFKIKNSRDNKMQMIQKNIEKKEIIKRNPDKLLINRFLGKSFSDKEDYKKNEEIQKFRKLWYPDEK